ncbi:MAG: SusC/RagA family TonB-linked outer membrane protein [Bacteroidota bacterium]|nr:SusC/RagA family TonB-linked outer membrane protein [Bacteroidota bacterium]
MKLTLLLTFICLINVNAAIYSQDKVFSFNLKDKTIRDVISMIETKSDFRFFYNDNFKDLDRKVNIKVKNNHIENILDEILSNSDVTYKVLESNFIVITPKTAVQRNIVSGIVTDKTTGEPLPGVNIVVKGTTRGAVTDLKGQYSIEVQKSDVSLIFSYLGYLSEECAIAGKSTIDVKMSQETKNLEEVVVVGYGVQKKSVVTGSIAVINSQDLINKKYTRLDEALQGLTSGVTVAQSSGAPGAAPTIRVRGTTSINNSDPLYVVDGIVINSGIEYLNPNDIASIEVLKDAASASIYGSRSSNGVILITTKKGKTGSQMQVNYNMQAGFQGPIKKVDLTNATQYAQLRNEAITNDGGTAIFQNPQALGSGTNWQDEIFSNHAGYQNHSLSISGGTDKASYYASFGYIDQKGIIAPSIAYNKKLTFTINTSYKISPYISIGENLSYTYGKSQTDLNTNSEFGGPLSSALNLDPITPVYTDTVTGKTYPQYTVKNGDQYYAISKYVGQEMTNPQAYIQTKKGNYNWSHNLVGNVYIEITPFKDLVFRSSINAKKAFWGSESFNPLYYLTAYSNNMVSTSQYRESDQNLIWNFDNTLSYNKSLGQHNFSIMIGSSAQKTTAEGVNTKYIGEPALDYHHASFNYSLAAVNKIGGGYEDQDYAMYSYFGRLTYNYNEKYLVNGILRRDGSSKFGSNNKFGIFPSASIGWVITREDFFPKETFVDNLKLRASYGIVGNEMSLGDFAYESLIISGSNYVLGNNNFTIGNAADRPANPDLKWEETHSTDLGFDATIFRSFTISFDAYKKTTKGMLQTVQVPSYAGFTNSPFGNVGNMENKGLELDLGYQRSWGDLLMNVKGNISYLMNKVTYLGEGKQFLDGGATLQSTNYPLTRTAVGHAIGSFYGFKTLGVFHSQSEINNYRYGDGTLIQPNAKPGDFKWQDTDGKGGITSDDRTWIGDPTPNWTYGLTLNLFWKNWDMMIFGQGVWGNDIFQGYRRLDIPSANYPIAALNAWTTKNSSSNYPRLTDSDPNHNFNNPSDFYLQNGAYFRIKNIQIGYTLPKAWTNYIKLQSVRLFISSSNLFTITKYNGYDPEVGGSSYGIDRGIYPQSRTFLFGLNVGL